MAIYHLNARFGNKKSGDSAGAKSEYVEREGKYQNDADEVLFKTSGNMPAWAKDRPGVYWKVVDKHERKNAKLFYEVEFSLPRELNREQQIDLVNDFAGRVASQPKDAGPLPYTLAIHKGNGENPHCHLLLSDRGNDGIDRDSESWFKRANKKAPEKGGAAKTRSLQPKDWVLQTREMWADYANRALEKAGRAEKIDHRSYADQGIDKIPGIHLGPNVIEMEQRGIRTERGEIALERAELQAELNTLVHERNRVDDRLLGADSTRQSPPGAGDRDFIRSDQAVSTGAGGLSTRRPGSDERNENDVQSADGTADKNHQDFPEQSLEGPDVGGRTAGSVYSSSTECILDLAAGVSAGLSKEGVSDDRSGHERSYSPKPSMGAVIRRKPKKDKGVDQRLVEEKKKRDRTREAVENQLRAMNCERYDVGVRDSKSGKMMNKTGLTWEEILEKRLQWLKMMNYKGNDIYIRPAKDEKHGLVLVDDVEGWQVDSMRDSGHSPCCVVETSPGNMQAWVKIESPEGVSDELRKTIARKLAQSYVSDSASADARHYGRLAGFTNQKEKYEDRYGQQPYCLLRDSNGKPAPEGLSLVQDAEQAIETRAVKFEQHERVTAISFARDSYDRLPAKDEYKWNMKQLHRKYGDSIDWSVADYMTAKSMLKSKYDPQEIKAAMAECSPGIESRKKGHIEDYCNRTVDKALADPDVQAVLERQKENPFKSKEQEHEKQQDQVYTPSFSPRR